MASPILDTIIADINGIVPQYSAIVSSYRLLVGSAEETQTFMTRQISSRIPLPSASPQGKVWG